MGKVVKFTGSRLLGEELRRLRAGRTLDDVVELGKTKLVPSGFRYVGKGTLSDIENGKVLPNLESVFALSVLYQVPASRFLQFLLEENVVRDASMPASVDELARQHAEAVLRNAWTEALALSVHGCRHANGPAESMRWRLNRAVALERLGLRMDAIAELNACVESPHLAASDVFKVHRELARMHINAGQPNVARLHVDEAWRMMPASTPDDLRALLLETRIRLIVSQIDAGQLPKTAEWIEQALGWVRECRLLISRTSLRDHFALDLFEARLRLAAGDAKASRRLVDAVLRRAREVGDVLRQVEALTCSGVQDAESKPIVANARLRQAADLAMEHGFTDHAFIALFHLLKTAPSAEQRQHYFRRCQKLYPLIQASTPLIRQFELMRLDEVT